MCRNWPTDSSIQHFPGCVIRRFPSLNKSVIIFQQGGAATNTAESRYHIPGASSGAPLPSQRRLSQVDYNTYTPNDRNSSISSTSTGSMYDERVKNLSPLRRAKYKQFKSQYSRQVSSKPNDESYLPLGRMTTKMIDDDI